MGWCDASTTIRDPGSFCSSALPSFMALPALPRSGAPAPLMSTFQPAKRRNDGREAPSFPPHPGLHPSKAGLRSSTHYSHSHPIVQNLVLWACLTAKKSEKLIFSLVVMFPPDTFCHHRKEKCVSSSPWHVLPTIPLPALGPCSAYL